MDYDERIIDDAYEGGVEHGKKVGAKEELEKYIELLKKWDFTQFNQMGSCSGEMVYNCILHDLEKRAKKLTNVVNE